MPLELDVHVTKDLKVIVCHDSELKRVTGKEGIIEDLTYAYIRNHYRLLDGEMIPSFKEVLDLIQERVPIVCELKVYKRNYKILAQKVKEELKVIKDKKNISLISFDPRALFPFKHDGFSRVLLIASSRQDVLLFRNAFDGLDIEYNLLRQPKVMKYAQTHFMNAWTIQDEEAYQYALGYCDTMTFQHLDPDKITQGLKEHPLE